MTHSFNSFSSVRWVELHTSHLADAENLRGRRGGRSRISKTEQSRAEQSRGRESAVIDGCLGGGVLKVARGGTTCVECDSVGRDTVQDGCMMRKL